VDVPGGPRGRALLEAARRGDGDAFGQLVEPYRGELHAHCYRMLGSVQDAEDAVQEALLGAWRGLAGFEGRSSLRAWLYRIATNACLRLLARRPRRLLSPDRGPAAAPLDPLGEPLPEAAWLEPYPDEQLGLQDGFAAPEARYELRESVELAFVAALQHLPATQRAVLILREVLGFSAAEVAESLQTTVASVNSALQRARRAVDRRVPARSQQATLRALGEDGLRELVEGFVAAWERADVDAILGMLAEDARFTMPPLPSWFSGREDVGVFLAERVFATPWRLVPMRASAQPALAVYQGDPRGGRFRLSALDVLTLRGRQVLEITAFLHPAVHRRFGLPAER
jgi:RNA polymerase sigma-70 factor (TIGR02960 family)